MLPISPPVFHGSQLPARFFNAGEFPSPSKLPETNAADRKSAQIASGATA